MKMKRALSIILCVAMTLSGCAPASQTNKSTTETTVTQEESSIMEDRKSVV